ncbi:hypothetical protein Sm713_59310 [Streptomyces sp. TS71-3]|nr:hypothetical protein Sm713_59310 [Streptomyces sp. TS71-3]
MRVVPAARRPYARVAHARLTLGLCPVRGRLVLGPWPVRARSVPDAAPRPRRRVRVRGGGTGDLLEDHGGTVTKDGCNARVGARFRTLRKDRGPGPGAVGAQGLRAVGVSGVPGRRSVRGSGP